MIDRTCMSLVRRLLLLLLFLGMVSVPAFGAHPISWEEGSISLTVFPGTSSNRIISFSSSEDVPDVTLQVVPELARFLSLGNSRFGPIKAGRKYSLNLTAAVPSSTPTGIYEGTLGVRSGKSIVPFPLKIAVQVQVPSARVVPSAVSVPTPERITADDNDGGQYVRDEAIVILQPSASCTVLTSVLIAHRGAFIGSITTLSACQIQFPGIVDPLALDQLISRLRQVEGVRYASRSWVDRTRPRLPNDSSWDSWDEQQPAGNNWAHEFVGLPTAWGTSTGSRSVKLAILDTGFDTQHADLRSNISAAFDLALSVLVSTEDNHGTAVAGIASAQGDNRAGISGVMWESSLLLYAMKIPFTEDSMLSISVISAASDAIARGAQIINYSGGQNLKSLETASRINALWRYALLDSARSKAVLFVFAAGEVDVDDKYSSPSSLSAEFDNVISVTSIQNQLDRRFPLAVNANFGNVSVAAPGEAFMVAVPGDRYEVLGTLPAPLGGTSFAAPLVSGIAGLVWSVAPTLIASQVKSLIVRGAQAGGRKVLDWNTRRPPNSPVSLDFYVVNAAESMRLALSNDIVVQPGPNQGKDLWTTSVYSYAPGGGGPGGGINDETLRVGGWGDEYRSLMQFDVSGASLPVTASKAVLRLYNYYTQGSGTTPMALYRITQFWDWTTQGTGSDRLRLWWADQPAATQLGATTQRPAVLPAPPAVGFYDIDITDLYNFWKSSPTQNFGLELRPTLTDNYWNYFYSTDYLADRAKRPQLIITP